MQTGDIPGDISLPAPPLHARPAPLKADRLYFTGLAGLCAVIIFIGFSPSYYLSHWMGRPHAGSLTPMQHVHGALFTLWLALAVTQPALIAGGHRRLHMTLGWAALVLWPVMLVLIWQLAVANLRAGGFPGGPPPDVIFALSTGAIPSLTAMIALGLLWRRTPATHKRLMAMTWGPMLGPGVGRILAAHGLPIPLVLLCTPLVILSGVTFDLSSRRRVHRVWAVGGPLLIAYMVLFQIFAHTSVWQRFCAWLA